MSRYIDADRLMLELNDWWYSQTKIESQNIPYDDNISVTIREAMEAVKEQPTASQVTVSGSVLYAEKHSGMAQ